MINYYFFDDKFIFLEENGEVEVVYSSLCNMEGITERFSSLCNIKEIEERLILSTLILEMMMEYCEIKLLESEERLDLNVLLLYIKIT